MFFFTDFCFIVSAHELIGESIGNPKFSTVMLINRWIDSKMSENLDSYAK
jgi:hypothetical protein